MAKSNEPRAWKIGDCCYLKSGSGKMVIEDIDGDYLRVCWVVYGVGTMYHDRIHKETVVWTHASTTDR